MLFHNHVRLKSDDILIVTDLHLFHRLDERMKHFMVSSASERIYGSSDIGSDP